MLRFLILLMVMSCAVAQAGDLIIIFDPLQSGGGAISGVSAGTGLTGGGVSGVIVVALDTLNVSGQGIGWNSTSNDFYVDLSELIRSEYSAGLIDSSGFIKANFASSGSVDSVARSDHTHDGYLLGSDFDDSLAVYDLDAFSNVLAMTEANGDIFYYNNGWINLPKGSDGEFLKLASGLPSWGAGSGGDYLLLSAVEDSIQANAYYPGGTDVADEDVANDITASNYLLLADFGDSVSGDAGAGLTYQTDLLHVDSSLIATRWWVTNESGVTVVGGRGILVTDGTVHLDSVNVPGAGLGWSSVDEAIHVLMGYGLTQDGDSVEVDTTIIATKAYVGGNFGDITGVTAGTGLSGGGASGAVTLNVNGDVVTFDSDWATAILINAALTGDTLLTQSTNFAGDVTGTHGATVVGDDSHNHVIGNVDNLQDSLNIRLYASAFDDSAAAREMVYYGSGDNTFRELDAVAPIHLATESGYLQIVFGWESAQFYMDGDSLGILDDGHSHVIGNVDNLQDSLNVKMYAAAFLDSLNANDDGYGDITSVTAGKGLDGGATEGAVTLDVLLNAHGGLDFDGDSITVKADGITDAYVVNSITASNYLLLTAFDDSIAVTASTELTDTADLMYVADFDDSLAAQGFQNADTTGGPLATRYWVGDQGYVDGSNYLLLSAVEDSVQANAYYPGGTDVADEDVANDITASNYLLLSSFADSLDANDNNYLVADTITVTLSPEFVGSLLDTMAITGGNHTGDMTTVQDSVSAITYYNAYHWTTSLGSVKYFYIKLEWQLPTDFSSWDTNDAIKFYYKTTEAATTNNSIQVQVYENGVETIRHDDGEVGSATWTSASITSAELNSGWVANDVARIIIRMKANVVLTVDKDSWLGRIQFKYIQ